jgi:hypothetical protein
MLNKTLAIAAVSTAALLSATPVLADGYRHGNGHARDHGRGQKQVVVVHKQAPFRADRRVVMHRPAVHRHVVHRQVVVHQPAPTVVYRRHSSHEVLGGLIVGAVLGAVLASHGGY